MHNRVLRCAEILKDSLLLAKLTSGHMSAREHKYHPSCLLALYYKASRFEILASDIHTGGHSSQEGVNSELVALAEILA